MDRRTLLAIGLSLVFFIGWQKFYIEPRLPKPGTTTAQTRDQEAASAAPTVNDASVSTNTAGGTPVNVAAKNVEAKSFPIQTAKGPAAIGDAGKFFTAWQIDQYRQTLEKDSSLVNLPSVTQGSVGAEAPAGFTGEGELAFDLKELAYANNVAGKMVVTGNTAAWTYEDANLKLRRDYSFGADKNYVDLTLTAEFKTKRPDFAFVSLTSQSPAGDKEEVDRQLLTYQNDSLDRHHLKGLDENKDLPGEAKWIAAQSRYFLMTLVPSVSAPRALIQRIGRPDDKHGKISLVFPVKENKITIPMKAYFGPKEMNALHTVDPTLDKTIDFGWFTFFAYPIMKLMKLINTGVGNWGLSIILLTLLIKLVTFPLTYKSTKSMKKIAKLQPQMKALQDKHKDDKEALNREMITFMRESGYNPVAGCLPIVIQMPVFFALYRVLYSSIELYQAPFMGWIRDLSHKDPLYVTPVLLTLLMWLQQKLTPNTATDPMQAKMLQYMPVFFGLMMLNLPAGLTIYMLVNAGISVVQQKYLNKKFANA